VNRRELLLLLCGAMTAGHTLRAQQNAMTVIGFLGSGSLGSQAVPTAAFREGLAEAGYIEGHNLTIEYRWAEGRYDRLTTFAAELIDRKVDVIVASGVPAALAAKKATSTIPIVFIGSDPVERGLVASLARPGGNLTGINFFSVELHPKRLELIAELVHGAGVIALLVNPDHANAERIMQAGEDAARAKGVELPILKASSETEIDAAFATLNQQHVQALVVGADAFFDSRREQLIALAARHGLPAIYAWREFCQAGGLISYGPSLAGALRQLGNYAGRILKGASPADLPVQQPTTFDLVVNLKTAKALGLTVPPSILASATEVIE
jgi:putative ABC transport system substrate-binding protein